MDNLEKEQEELEEQEPKEIDPAIVQEAINTGWQPKENFKGDTSKWRPADEWVERGRNFIPFIKAQNKDLVGEVRTLKGELAETKETMDKIVKVQSKYSDDFYDTKASDIKRQMREAAENENWDKYNELDKQRDSLKKPEPVATPEQTENSVSPEMRQWAAQNQWYMTNPKLRDYAQFIESKMYHSQDPLTQPGREVELADEIKRQVVETFPQDFSNQNQLQTDTDETNFRGSDGFEKKDDESFDSLPQAAKDAYNSMSVDLPKLTKEQYAKDYYEA